MAGPLSRSSKLWLILPLVGGLLLSFRSMLISGFRLTPGDEGDAALVNYLVEHDYRWVVGNRLDSSYWDTPIFYPTKNTTAYTETLLLVAPLYVPWRILGSAPDTAFQLWFLVVSVLNFVACYWVLWRLLRVTAPGSALGAYLFSFGSSRMIQTWHPQLFPAFFVVGALAGLLLLFDRSGDSTPQRRLTGIFLYFGCFTAQLYSSVYWGWFLLLASTIAAIAAVVHTACRPVFLGALRDHWKWLILAVALSAALTAPLALHSLAVRANIGGRGYLEVQGYLPGLPSWFKQSARSTLYGWLDPHLKVHENPAFWEESNGIGLFTTLFLIWAVWECRRSRVAQLLIITSAALVVLSLRLPNGASFWWYVFEFFPGSTGIRAVGRIGLFLLLPAALLIALGFQKAAEKSPKFAMVVAVLLVCEQLVFVRGHDKFNFRSRVQSVASAVGPQCSSFFFSPPTSGWTLVLAQDTAMWASQSTNVPTLNGSSGLFPPGWGLFQSTISTSADVDRLSHGLRAWLRFSRLSPDGVCWIRQQPPATGFSATPIE